MTQTTLHYPGFAERVHGEISLEDLRSLLCRIEPDLQESVVYKRMLESLQQSLADVPGGAPFLLKALTREVIRLSAQQFQPADSVETQLPPLSPVATTPVMEAKPLEEVKQPSSSPENAVKEETLPQQTPEGSATDALPVSISMGGQHPGTAKPKIVARKKPKPTKAELVAQAALKAWQQRLVEIGVELKQLRLQKSISQDQLHHQTRVPLYQIKALELGAIEHLPEDVYVRGFIRALGNALGIDGASLSASLPNPNPSQTIVPSWYQSSQAVNDAFYLKPIHIYAGYATLMAGASGALLWMSYNSSSTAFTQPEIIGESQAPTYQNAVSKAQPNHTPGVKAGVQGAIAGPDIAPPEPLMF